ncbi:AI-2E family transporter [Methanobrevibacter arboriphilus]|uniref:AI-2E family transporter n=1 Tax=Methanobrevibacter arboriphilus TaxID=39441 RepID=UPI002F2B3BA3
MSIILSIVIVVIPLILLFAYTISVTIDLSYTFINNNHNILSQISFNQTTSIINSYIPTEMQSSTESITTTITELINDILKLFFGYFIEFVKSLPFVMIQVFVLIFSTFYFARDGYKVKSYVKAVIPKEKHQFFGNMIKEIKTVLKSIFYGHFLTGFIIGLIATIGFLILGYPYALFLGILTGVCQLIPLIGPWPVYTILFIYDMVSGNYVRGIIVLLFGFGLSLSDMYIRPTLSGKYVDIHPMILLLGFVSGPIVFGLIGFILGPLILGITYAVVKTYKNEKERLSLENKNVTI